MILYLVLSFLFSFFTSAFVQASTQNSTAEVESLPNGQIYISEIYPAPSETEKEWIELFNQSENELILTDMQLYDSISSESLLHTFDTSTIQPYSFLVIELETSKLNNTGDIILLKNTESEIVDSFEYSETTNQKSIARLFFEATSLTNSFTIESPSPNQINSFYLLSSESEPTPTPTSTENTKTSETQDYPKIIIDSAKNCPQPNDSESVTLKNLSTELVELNDWYLQDNHKNTVSLKDQSILDSRIIHLSKSILNNSGDTIFLYNPDQKMVSLLELPSCDSEINSKNEDSNENHGDSAKKQQIQKEVIRSQISDSQQTDPFSEKYKLYHLLSKELISQINLEYPKDSEFKTFTQHIVTQKESSKSAILNVIIGGTILLISGIVL